MPRSHPFRYWCAPRLWTSKDSCTTSRLTRRDCPTRCARSRWTTSAFCGCSASSAPCSSATATWSCPTGVRRFPLFLSGGGSDVCWADCCVAALGPRRSRMIRPRSPRRLLGGYRPRPIWWRGSWAARDSALDAWTATRSRSCCTAAGHPSWRAPSGCELRADHLRLDGQYARVLVLTAYPRLVAPGWLSLLVETDLPIEVSLHVQPLASADMVRSLGVRIARLQASRLAALRGERIADPEREIALEDAERLRERLQRGEERLSR